MIGSRGRPHAHAEVELPVGRKHKINGRQNLLLLLAQRVEARHRPQGAVILETGLHFLGLFPFPFHPHVIAELEVRRKLKAFADARAMKGAIKRRVEGEIPAIDFFVDDRPNFPRPGIGRVNGALVSELLREAKAYRQMPAFRNAETRPDVVAHPGPAVARLHAGEDVEAGLKPRSEAVGDLDGLMILMIGRAGAVVGGLAALESKIHVALDHRASRLHGFIRIYLHLIVSLAVKGGRPKTEKREHPFSTSPCHCRTRAESHRYTQRPRPNSKGYSVSPHLTTIGSGMLC